MVDTRFGIIRNTLLEEIRLALQRDHIHKVERICRIVMLLVTQRDKEAVRDELNVLAHQICVHANKLDRKGICKELLLNGDGFRDDTLDNFRMRTALQVAEEEAGKVGMHSLVT